MSPLKPAKALLQLLVSVGVGEGKVDHTLSLLQTSEFKAHVEGAIRDPKVRRVPNPLPAWFSLHLNREFIEFCGREERF